MKKVSIFAILLICVPLFAQQWHIIPNAIKDSANNLREVYFVNKDTGIIIALNSDNSSAIFRSIDGGKTWNKRWVGRYAGGVNDISFYGKNISWVVLGNGYPLTIEHTVDCGITWTDLPNPIICSNGDTLEYPPYFSFPSINIGGMAATDSSDRIFKSIDSGMTWTEQTDIDRSNLDSASQVAQIQGIYFSDTLNGIIIGENANYVTKDGGNHWIATKIAWPKPPSPFGPLYRSEHLKFISKKVGFTFSWVLSKTSSVNFPNWTFQAFRTVDGGESWNNFVLPFSVLYVLGDNNLLPSISFINADTGWCIGSDTCYDFIEDPYSCNCIPPTSSFDHEHCQTCYESVCKDRHNSIMLTKDGGATWSRDFHLPDSSVINSNPRSAFNFTNIFILNDSTGWAVGTNGAVAIYTKSDVAAISNPKSKIENAPMISSRLDANGMVVILTASAKGNLRLCNLQGKIVWAKQNYCLLKGVNRFAIETNKIAPGCYVFMSEISGKKGTTPLFFTK